MAHTSPSPSVNPTVNPSAALLVPSRGTFGAPSNPLTRPFSSVTRTNTRQPYRRLKSSNYIRDEDSRGFESRQPDHWKHGRSTYTDFEELDVSGFYAGY